MVLEHTGTRFLVGRLIRGSDLHASIYGNREPPPPGAHNCAHLLHCSLLAIAVGGWMRTYEGTLTNASMN